MATFKVVIYEQWLRKSDDKYPVSIRVYWQKQLGFIDTQYYVTKKQLTRNLELKDSYIINDLNNRIEEYEELKKTKLKEDIYNYTAKELAEYFENYTKNKNKIILDEKQIDFIEFCKEVIANTSNKGTAGIYEDTLNSVIKLTGGKLYTNEITVQFLKDYEKFLREKDSDRGSNRKGQAKSTSKLKGTGINLYLRTFRALFNDAKEKYNDEDKGIYRIPQTPFKKYKIPKPSKTEKKALEIETIKIIRDMEVILSREILARDISMLSFYLIGMNTIDLFEVDSYKDGRISYNRHKTENRRDDQAYISVKVEQEALPLLKKYCDPFGKRVFNFYHKYTNAEGFNKAVNKGLKYIGKHKDVNIPDLKYYAFRHSWATIARNNCHIAKSDVDEYLNHASEFKLVDVYIKKDWTPQDEANRQVLDALL